MGDSGHLKKASRIVFSVFAAVLLVFIVYFVPLPYYIFKPGTAEVLAPMVHAKQAAGEDKGQFMLTTVQLSEVNIAGYLMSFVSPYQELRLKSELLKNNETREEYSQRQVIVMHTSQADAIQAAYNELKIPYHIRKDGIVVQQVYPEFPASEVLRAGDYITELEGAPIQTYDEMRAVLQNKKAGDSVKVSYKRGDVTRTKDIALAVLPDQEKVEESAKRVGLGIVPAEVHSVQADRPEHQIDIQAGAIGGPSAGLMFSLEIMNRLSPEDLTKGHRIAGTGEIDPEGRVGVIGGIMHKVVAADRAGAEIFFAPKDAQTAGGAVIPNYSAAVQRAKEIGTSMKIVPVGTVKDALSYLDTLEPKSS
ncbi:PDZ domain-containing protein [Paenibacillus sp. UNCCL117]|uniref:SepM family pheromone-processing serine protease n=1 Tax=unclassified Paenibacillus TaxID=185978 RepID=UPI00088F3562|nr:MULTISPECIES: SepM family pheromone-processing serine protease [unclassified Paenibacillus]SDD95942.1 PDZ domain-containing protein [Paenibacillus sp. cl123]SFW56503.1 PDZ domain-containing protein [Paenibacillus sp. UNCCL117]